MGTPNGVGANLNLLTSSGVNVIPYASPIFSRTATRSSCLSMLMNTLPSLSTKIWRISVSGILISITEAGVETCIGSFWMKVDVSIKKVSKSTVTSLIAVMSMNVLCFFTFTLAITRSNFFLKVRLYALQHKSEQW